MIFAIAGVSLYFFSQHIVPARSSRTRRARIREGQTRFNGQKPIIGSRTESSNVDKIGSRPFQRTAETPQRLAFDPTTADRRGTIPFWMRLKMGGSTIDSTVVEDPRT